MNKTPSLVPIYSMDLDPGVSSQSNYQYHSVSSKEQYNERRQSECPTSIVGKEGLNRNTAWHTFPSIHHPSVPLMSMSTVPNTRYFRVPHDQHLEYLYTEKVPALSTMYNVNRNASLRIHQTKICRYTLRQQHEEAKRLLKLEQLKRRAGAQKSMMDTDVFDEEDSKFSLDSGHVQLDSVHYQCPTSHTTPRGGIISQNSIDQANDGTNRLTEENRPRHKALLSRYILDEVENLSDESAINHSDKFDSLVVESIHWPSINPGFYSQHINGYDTDNITQTSNSIIGWQYPHHSDGAFADEYDSW